MTETTGFGARLEVAESSFYAGPLPPASEMERYAALDPDAVRVILRQFTEQGRHRRAVEAALVAGDERRADRGQLLAATLVALGILGGTGHCDGGRRAGAGGGVERDRDRERRSDLRRGRSFATRRRLTDVDDVAC